MDPRIVAQTDAGIPHSKLNEKAYGPFKIKISYENVAIVNLAGIHTLMALDRLKKAPPVRAPPQNSNKVRKNDEIDVPFPVNKPPSKETEELDVHTEDIPEQVEPGDETAVHARVLSHHTRGLTTTNEVQMENDDISMAVPEMEITSCYSLRSFATAQRRYRTRIRLREDANH